MGKLRGLLKVRPKRGRTNWLIKLFLIFALLMALNFSLLLPPQISSLFYELELGTLQFFNFPVILHRYELFIIILLSSLGGIWLFPVLSVPMIEGKRGDSHIYIWTWREGDLRYFRTITGELIAVNDDVIAKRGLRYTVIADVFESIQGGETLLQTKDLEVSTAIMWKRLAESLMEENAQLKEIIKRSGVLIEKAEVMDLMSKEVVSS